MAESDIFEAFDGLSCTRTRLRAYSFDWRLTYIFDIIP